MFNIQVTEKFHIELDTVCPGVASGAITVVDPLVRNGQGVNMKFQIVGTPEESGVKLSSIILAAVKAAFVAEKWSLSPIKIKMGIN